MHAVTDRQFVLPLEASTTLSDTLIIEGSREIIRAMQLRLGGAIVHDRSLYSLILSSSLEHVVKHNDFWQIGRHDLRLRIDERNRLVIATARHEWITLILRWGGEELKSATPSPAL
ncbi:MAG: hypothetical protein UZ21_OP11001001174 [Microgenomates bacterium OLB22]|nr:MAG: hypothetical protein UZ21_OP11001001174 [Microgenomates bacterium OLB22]